MNRVYFDWAATSPLFPSANKVPVYGNPSSLHQEGRKAKAILEDARERCAAVLGVKAETLYFCSGGTEANHLILNSLLVKNSEPGLLYTAVEHPSVRMQAGRLSRLGIRSDTIAVESDGRVSVDILEKALKKNSRTSLLCIMQVNNETGAIHDMEQLSDCCRKHSRRPVHLHCDAVQALGKVPFNPAFCDSASFSAHKIGGPKGTGLLYLKKPLEVLGLGGGQERGIRPGTENIQGAAAFAERMENICTEQAVKKNHAAATERWASLYRELKSLKRCTILPEERTEQDSRFSPYILQASFKDIPGEVMLRTLDDAGIAVSTGSACSAGETKRPVLSAMGISDTTAFSAVRFSQGWTTSMDDINRLLDAIRDTLQRF